jgi:hypothetical protein
MSLRELCRLHGISAHSLVVVQARQGRWREKREAHQARASESFITRHADRLAAREAEVRDHVLDAIDEAVTKFRADLRATKSVRRPDGRITDEPAWHMKPKDLVVLIDRLLVLFEQPASTTQQHGLSVSTAISAEAFREFVEATRMAAGPPSHLSPMPRTPGRLGD